MEIEFSHEEMQDFLEGMDIDPSKVTQEIMDIVRASIQVFVKDIIEKFLASLWWTIAKIKPEIKK